MRRILRGEIVWAELRPLRGHEQGGRRPVLVLGDSDLHERSGKVIAMTVTSQEPRVGYPLTVELDCPELPRRSWLKLAQIRTLDTSRLGECIGTASLDDLDAVIDGLLDIIGG